MEMIVVTPTLRTHIVSMLERERAQLATLRHVSGDECAHCGSRMFIRELEEALETGVIEEPEDDDDDMGEL